jgi:hypothetical protein
MRYFWPGRATRCLPRMFTKGPYLLLVALLSLLLIGVNPRSMFGHRPQNTRCHDSRRAKPTRDIEALCGFKKSETDKTTQPLAQPRAESLATKASGGRLSFCTSGLISLRISSELTKPQYLKLFTGDPQRTSLPS